MNLKLRYSIIIIDLSLKNPKMQELPGALPPGPPTRALAWTHWGP